MYYLGIDVGSITTKAVVLSNEDSIMSSSVVRTGSVVKEAIDDVCKKVLQNLDIPLNEIVYGIATGYGRKNVTCVNECVTEITAHAHGARCLFPGTRLIIDIGGQDTKIIELTENGDVEDFVMNDKCAAGTGRFLEVMAELLDVSLEKFGEKALAYSRKIKINSTCTVFAESEVISLISRKEKREDIAFAIHDSVVERIIALVRKLPIAGEITLSGGVSYNSAIQNIIQERLGQPIHIPENPQIIGALGAAFLAKKYSKD